jgi:hypothetical protein
MHASLRTLVGIALLALPVLAQNPVVDMNLWTVEHINGSGPWTIDAPRLRAESTNAAITDCSTFYSDFQVSVLEFRMRVDPAGGDDDVIGFLLGWQPGASTSATADFLLVDWKKTTQAFQDWGTAQAGLAISRQTGPMTRGYGNAPIDLWSHTLNCTELARSPTHGSSGWDFGVDYFFRVVYTPTSVDIWLNGQPQWSLTGSFPPGRFACYNFSQSRTAFRFPLPGAATSYGAGCAGSNGTPFLFVPETPLVGSQVPVLVANLPPAAIALLVLGLSDTSWQGTPLPLNLGVLGAPACSLLASADFVTPVVNFQGTAYLSLALPPTLVPSPSPLLFVQGMATDFAANPLGLVFSNAAAVVVGIQ